MLRWIQLTNCRRFFVFTLVASLALFEVPRLAQAADVLVTRNDINQTGANLQESTLSVGTVARGKFGRLFAYPVVGNIYAQPLVVSNVQTPLGQRDVLYVVTTDNFVYAFDANSNAVNSGMIWWRHFGKAIAQISYGSALLIPVPVGAGPLSGPILRTDPVHFAAAATTTGTTFEGDVGIVGTPVIDRGRNTMYLVARSKDGAQYVQTLHALDISNGSEKTHSPMEIARDASPVGFAALENQRAGLALVLNRIVVAWAGPGGKENSLINVNGQQGSYHGYVMAFDADTLVRTGCFTTGSREHVMAGIWQAGRAPVIDAAGFAYFFTGNGISIDPKAANQCDSAGLFPAPQNLTNSLVKLDVRNGLALVEAIPDPHVVLLDTCDLDLAGSGPMRVPNSSLILGGGKEGFLHVIAPDAAGKIGFQSSQQIYPGPVEDFGGPTGDAHNADCQNHGMHHVMGGPTYWESASLGPVVYISVENDVIRAFKLDKSALRLEATPLSTSAAFVYKHPAAILSLSADGNRPRTGVLWAVHADRTATTPGSPYTDPVRGILRAFDAEDLSHELWNSDLVAGDAFGDFAKFTPVTVANGHVYVPTFSGQIVVYGRIGELR
jgi:outer membrane protein assembly factor BamB